MRIVMHIQCVMHMHCHYPSTCGSRKNECVHAGLAHRHACLPFPHHMQADAGATTVLTQPLFDSDAFSAWTEDAARRGIWERVELIVGHPTITSYTGLSFWLALSGMNGQAAALKLQSALQAAQQEGGAEGLDAHCRQYALDIVSKVSVLGEPISLLTPPSFGPDG